MPSPDNELNLTTVCTVSGQLVAQVLKGKLESAGIPVLLKYESAGIVIGVTVDGLGEVHVQVPAEFADEARMLLEETDEVENGEEEDLPGRERPG